MHGFIFGIYPYIALSVLLIGSIARYERERAKLERGAERAAEREAILRQAQAWLERALVLDSENADAHWNLALVHEELGERDWEELDQLLATAAQHVRPTG